MSGRRPATFACLLAILILVAACSSGGNTSADSYQTTAGAPTAGEPEKCPAPHPVAGGQEGTQDWTTYHKGNDRHGVDLNSPAAKRLRGLWGALLDGSTFTQPLVYQGLVIVATEHNSVYAFDAGRGCLAWQSSLGPSVDARGLKCGNIPEVGVTSTPVIDPTALTLYTLSRQPPGRFELVALELGSGTVRWRHPIELSNTDVLYQLNRPALALANGRIYAAFGGVAGDCGNYHGFVVGVHQDGSGQDEVFQVSPTREGAIWHPGGPVVLPNGDLLLATSNTDTETDYDGNNAVVRLSPALQKLDFFAPSNWRRLNQTDLDLGSVGPTLLDGGKIFQVGKEGIGYLLDLQHLGGIGGQLFSAKLDGGCYAIGQTAYRPPYVYVPCDHGMKALRIEGSRFKLAWTGPDFRSGSPIGAGGLVWNIDFEGGYLWGMDAVSGQIKEKSGIGTAQHFVSPSASDGRLYLPVGSRLLAYSFN